MIVEIIHKAWEKGKTVTALLLDVYGAFDNVSHARLLHNLRKRRIGGPVLGLIQSFISDRKTKLRMPDHMTDWIETGTGIPQGSPLSPLPGSNHPTKATKGTKFGSRQLPEASSLAKSRSKTKSSHICYPDRISRLRLTAESQKSSPGSYRQHEHDFPYFFNGCATPEKDEPGRYWSADQDVTTSHHRQTSPFTPC